MSVMKQEQIQVDYSPSITSYLTECRNEKGYSIQDVATHLRISSHYIEAIENNDGPRLPERVYVLGFVRSYAKFLGIDPEYCVRRFKEEILQEEAAAPLFFPTPLSSETAPSKKILLLSSVGLMVIFAIGYGIKQWSSTSQPIDHAIAEVSKPVMSNIQSATLNSSPQDSTAKEGNPETQEEDEDSNQENLEQTAAESTSTQELPQPSPTILAENRELNLAFSQPSWIEIKDPLGNIIIEKTFQAGENYTLSKSQGHTMRTGNAGGINVKIGAKPAQPLGKTGEVLSNLSLDAEALSAYLKQH